jgi:hypothetical protein
MKVHPRNEGTSTVDLVILVGMVVAVVGLIPVMVYLAAEASTHNGAPINAAAEGAAEEAPAE